MSGAEKQAARRMAKECLSRLSEADFRRIGARIAKQVFAHPLYKNAHSVFCFVGTGREIDTEPILTRVLSDGKTLLVPRCEENGGMTARRITDLSELSKGRFGIPEPGADAPAADKDQIDLVLLPCLAASPCGARLGRGGGYYDRFLADFPSDTLILCPQALLFDSLPEDAWDRRADGVITENGVITSRPAE